MKVDNIISKYELDMLDSIEKENFNKIIAFLHSIKCDFIEELVENYLDLFSIEYDEFVEKYKILNSKYNNNLLNEIKKDNNILEEFYVDF